MNSKKIICFVISTVFCLMLLSGCKSGVKADASTGANTDVNTSATITEATASPTSK